MTRSGAHLRKWLIDAYVMTLYTVKQLNITTWFIGSGGYIYIYVCIYMYVHKYKYMYINIYIYMYTCMYVYVYIYTYTHICLYIYLYPTEVSMQRSRHKYPYPYQCTYICVYAYVSEKAIWMHIYAHEFTSKQVNTLCTYKYVNGCKCKYMQICVYNAHLHTCVKCIYTRVWHEFT